MKAKKKKKQEKDKKEKREKKEKLLNEKAESKDTGEQKKGKKGKKKEKEKEKDKDGSGIKAAEDMAPSLRSGSSEKKDGVPKEAGAIERIRPRRQKSAGRRRSDRKEQTGPGSEAQSPEREIQPSEVFRALGDEVRLQILELLRGEELCGSELLKSLSIVQSTLSHHMKILCESGVVKCRRQGRWSYYSVNLSAFAAAGSYLYGYGEKR